MNSLQRILLIFTLVFLAGASFAQTRAEDCRQIDRVLARLAANHYQPVEITAAVKKEILGIYLGETDSRNRLFSVNQLEKLSEIADAKGLCAAYEASKKMYYTGIQRYDSLLHAFARNPVKFQKGEKLQLNFVETRHLRKTDVQLKAYVLQLLKYSYLNIAYNQSLEDSVTFTGKDLTPQRDQAWRDKLLKREEVYLQRIVSDSAATNKKLMDHFLNSIAMRFDPHSSFFSDESKSAFEAELSRETASFGVQLVENENFEIEVTDVVPGSAAWFSGEFTAGDIVESLGIAKGQKVELTLKGMSNLYRYLKNPQYPELDFNLRRKSGEKITVHLAKTEIENVENSFKGYLMEENGLKLGYIALPSFYTDFESDAQLGCANDVAKEILLLKKEGMSGLVLDLRENGGGSIKEAVELCGLFISEGPVCVLQNKDKKPYVLKDMNRGTVYDGPLIVLVNNTSASASEVVAGCLQDYQRALIVGDVTFGKGSAQSMYPVNEFANPNFPNPSGFLKITDGRFYHISSRSNQVTGIVPDVMVKDIYASVDFFREQYTPYRLDNDSTVKKVVYNKFPTGFTPELRKSEQLRIEKDPAFLALKASSDSLKRYVENDQQIPLEILPFMEYSRSKDAFMDRLDALQDFSKPGFAVKNVSFHQKMLDLNPLEKELNDEVIKSLALDRVLQETILIFRDFYTFDK